MIQRLTRGLMALALGTGCVASVAAVKPAHAERAPLTDFQASRLTLDALTATPVVVHRVVYHPTAAKKYAKGSHHHAVSAHAISTHVHAQVRNVVYSAHTSHASHGAKKARHRT